jgi:hypothetical protein
MEQNRYSDGVIANRLRMLIEGNKFLANYFSENQEFIEPTNDYEELLLALKNKSNLRELFKKV